jgi:rubrerythrin
MPHFENSCNVTSCTRKLTKEELIRGIRFNIAAEYEAIQLYEQIKESTENKLVQKVLTDIVNEEREHAGELLKLLTILAPDETKYYEEGAKEVEEMMNEKES